MLQKYSETGSVHDRPKSSRKRKISNKAAKQIAAKAKKGKHVRQITAELNTKSQQPVSRETVRRAIKKEGLVYLKIRKVDKLSEDNIKDRLRYAKEMKDFDYEQVLFTDEKTFYLTFVPQGAWVERGEHLEQEVPKWPKKLNVWGAIGPYFKTKLYFLRNI